MKSDIISLIQKQKIVTILRGLNKEQNLRTINALIEAGVGFAEITFDSSEKISAEDTAEIIQSLNHKFGNDICIGAGTVINTNQVLLAAQAGAKYIISPDTDVEIIKKTISLDLVSMPGALTPTEIKTANHAGADFVKLFPISNLGLSYIKALMAPLNHIKYIAVGGVTPENITEYLKAGICGFGIGSNIIKMDLIANNDYAAITELAKQYKQKLDQ